MPNPPAFPSPPDPDQQPDRPTSTTVILSQRAAAGDESAFDELYARHFGRVLRLTSLKLGRLLQDCEHEVEDAVQSAFADVFLRIRNGSIAGIHEDYAFRRYVATAAANSVRSMKRKKDAEVRGGKHRQVEMEGLFQLLGATQPGPETMHRLHELEGVLEKALLELPEHYRNVVELHCLQGMDYEQIAASGELRSKAGAVVDRTDQVRLMIHRARKRLDDRLQGYLQEGATR